MNILNIIDKLSEVNTGDSQNKSRREYLADFGSMGLNMAKAAVPIALLSSLPKQAMAKTQFTTIVDVLNFALTLEYLESSYYNLGVSSGVIVASDLSIFQQIKKHENSHVTFLQDTITALGGTPGTSPTFDFTAGGAFTPFTVYEQFLALSQAFEDTGVRAYKGQAGTLISNNDVLTAALQIHSVEARHASEVRRLRNKRGFDTTGKGWITANSRGTLPAQTQAVYDGEDNVMQGGVDVTTLTTVGTASVQEAFDEPLNETQVLAIASLFIVTH